MKKICFGLLILTFLFSFSSAVYAEETGHYNFEAINIPEEADAYLLVNTSIGDRERIKKKVKWKFIGWSIYTNVKKLDVTYKKFDIFARSNDTSNEIKFDYTFTDVKSVETSIGLDGSLKQSTSGKIYVVNVALDRSIRSNIGYVNEVTTTKQLKYSITVSPNTKVTMYVTGDAKLSNGAAKCYFCGLTIYKGNWEYVDVATEYYELHETKLS